MRRLAFLTLLLLGACKQGEGEYCQVSSDCKDGLTCNASTKQCQAETGGGDDDEDAAVEIDASVIDAGTIDAGIDASVPDAEVPDANP